MTLKASVRRGLLAIRRPDKNQNESGEGAVEKGKVLSKKAVLRPHNL